MFDVEQNEVVKKLQKSMQRIYDSGLRNVAEEGNLYPPLEVTPENAITLKRFLVVQHRGTFKSAELEEPWIPGSESIRVKFFVSLHFLT